MLTTDLGQRAEQAASDYLQQHGFTILFRNWRRRQCEIDIVAGKQRVLYFVEVKHRTLSYAGRGLDYITPRKLARMRFAARLFTTRYYWRGDYCLSAVEVGGSNFMVTEFVEEIIV